MPESLSSPLALLWPDFPAGAAPWACLARPFHFPSADTISPSHCSLGLKMLPCPQQQYGMPVSACSWGPGAVCE